MTYSNPDALVSTEWLADHLSAPDVRVVDASWCMPGSARDLRAEYNEQHIPGAVFFDIDDIANSDTDLPHMLPSPEKFSSKVRKLGLGDGVRIVIYDSNGGFMAAQRVWWTFRVFGHEDVSVLDGGLPKWLAEDRPVDDSPPLPRQRHFTPRMNTFLVRSREQVLANIDSGKEQTVDARSADRFAGTGKEPRAGLRLGHIPGSVNVPFQKVLHTDQFNVMRSAAEITEVFTDAGLDLGKPTVASCGSGVTASCLAFSLYLIGVSDVAVYDGSWMEWGADESLPLETSE